LATEMTSNRTRWRTSPSSMPRKDIIDFEIGDNEETMQYFTDLAKKHKKQVLIQAEAMKKVDSIEKLDITEVHDIIKKAEDKAKNEEL